MPAAARRRPSTDDWSQLRLLVTSPAQETYELLRPVVLCGQPAATRARETGVAARTLRRKAARFDAAGMRSLFEPDAPPAPDRRGLPLGIRKAIAELKAEYPPLGPFALARVCRHRFERPVSYHTVARVLAAEPLPLHPPRRLPRSRDVPDPVQRRTAIVDLYLDGWRPTAIAGDLQTTRARVYEVLRRWDAGGWPGLEDRSRAPPRPARTVDLKATAAVRRLRANPELGEFRIHAALAQLGIDLSPRTCGRILALQRELGAPRSTTAPREARPMPFAAVRRHQYWSVDVRYIEEHELGTGKAVYVISILENVSRALVARAISPRQDLTASLIVPRAAIETHGAPEVLVSDGGGVFRATHAEAIYAALGIAKREIDAGQARQDYVEPHFGIMRRMAISTTRRPRPGPSCRRSTTASSTPATTSRTPPAASAPKGGGVRPRCRAGSRAPGATRPTSTGSSACGRRGCSTPAGTSGSATGGRTGSGGSPASARRCGSMGRRRRSSTRPRPWPSTAWGPRRTGAGSGRSASPPWSRTAIPRRNRSCPRSTAPSGIPRAGWPPTGRAARAGTPERLPVLEPDAATG